jgi:hypothetical protein
MIGLKVRGKGTQLQRVRAEFPLCPEPHKQRELCRGIGPECVSNMPKRLQQQTMQSSVETACVAPESTRDWDVLPERMACRALQSAPFHRRPTDKLQKRKLRACDKRDQAVLNMFYALTRVTVLEREPWLRGEYRWHAHSTLVIWRAVQAPCKIKKSVSVPVCCNPDKPRRHHTRLR